MKYYNPSSIKLKDDLIPGMSFFTLNQYLEKGEIPKEGFNDKDLLVYTILTKKRLPPKVEAVLFKSKLSRESYTSIIKKFKSGA